MVRTLEDQVIPDATLARRFSAPYSRGVPVAQARETYPLLGRNSVFNTIDIDAVNDPRAGKVVLRFSEPIWTTNSDGGSYPAKNGMEGFALFSATSKMSSPSFSLPAGPPREGGTCAAAAPGASKLVRPGRGTSPGGSRQDAKGNAFVCDACYATAGNYFYPNVGTAQAARLVWCMRMIKADPTGQLLGQALVDAIEFTAREAHYRNLSQRLGHELGVWSHGRLTVPGFIEGRKGIRRIPSEPTLLPPQTGYSSTTDFFTKAGVVEDQVVGFFRIHDSGDLNVGIKIASWKAYLAAWEYVAKQLPGVYFWMPVRTWTTRTMVPELQRAAQQPNLVIRASALFVNEAPPQIPGVSASAVHRGVVGEGHYGCPVTPNDKSSCAQEECRACWLAPTLIPSYAEH
jgi:hypothetical protein